MGWKSMPADVQESAFERQIKEGKGYQIAEEFAIPAESTVWIYIQIPSDKDVLLQSRNILATAGPVRYKVHPGAPLIGPLGTEIIPEQLNGKIGPQEAGTKLHNIPATSVDITGIIPRDKTLVPAGQQSGSRGTDAQIFQKFFKVYPAGAFVAVSLSNSASITSYVELHYLWAEDVE